MRIKSHFAVRVVDVFRFGIEPLEYRVLLANASFAVVGDFGNAGSAEQDVSNLVKSWNSEFVLTTGDNKVAGAVQRVVVGISLCHL
jgi:hypothetical protein